MEQTNLQEAKELVHGLVVEKDNKGKKLGVNLGESTIESLRGALWIAEVEEVNTFLGEVEKALDDVDLFFDGVAFMESYAEEQLVGVLHLTETSSDLEAVLGIRFGGSYVENKLNLIEAGVDTEWLSELESRGAELFGKRKMIDRSMRSIGEAETDPILVKMIIAVLRVVSEEKDREWFRNQLERRMLGWKLKEKLRLRQPISPGILSPDQVNSFFEFLYQGDGYLPVEQEE